MPNFAGFGVIAVTFVALMGAGVAEASGLMAALIRLLVGASPRRLLAFILIFVGVLSSVASDAGYLILVPLGAAAFASVGRHPFAGMAACFAGVGAIFSVNPIPGPIDAMITEITNEALGAPAAAPLTILANYFFSIVSSIVLAITAAIITERIVEPRLGAFQPAIGGRADRHLHRGRRGHGHRPGRREAGPALRPVQLRWASWPSSCCSPSRHGAPLRDPVTGDIIGTTPFMDSLLFIITMFFLLAGVAFGFGARTFKHATTSSRP